MLHAFSPVLVARPGHGFVYPAQIYAETLPAFDRDSDLVLRLGVYRLLGIFYELLLWQTVVGRERWHGPFCPDKISPSTPLVIHGQRTTMARRDHCKRQYLCPGAGVFIWRDRSAVNNLRKPVLAHIAR